MQVIKSRKSHLKRKVKFKQNTKQKPTWKIIAFAIYITFILIKRHYLIDGNFFKRYKKHIIKENPLS